MPRIPVGTKCRLQTGYKMLTRYKMWTENLKNFFRLLCDNMTSYILPSVMQSLFRDQLSRLFALFWNIPGHLLIKIDRNIISSLHIVFSLCARVVGVMSVKIFCRCKCKRGVTVEYLTRATFEKQLTAFHVVLIIIFLSSVCFNFVDKNADRDQNCSFD